MVLPPLRSLSAWICWAAEEAATAGRVAVAVAGIVADGGKGAAAAAAATFIVDASGDEAAVAVADGFSSVVASSAAAEGEADAKLVVAAVAFRGPLLGPGLPLLFDKDAVPPETEPTSKGFRALATAAALAAAFGDIPDVEDSPAAKAAVVGGGRADPQKGRCCPWPG